MEKLFVNYFFKPVEEKDGFVFAKLTSINGEKPQKDITIPLDKEMLQEYGIENGNCFCISFTRFSSGIEITRLVKTQCNSE